MAKVLFTANSFEICLAPIKIKGRLIRTIKEDRSKLVKMCNNSEIPMAPPSRKSLGKRKLFNPIVAEAMPANMKNMSFAFLDFFNLDM